MIFTCEEDPNPWEKSNTWGRSLARYQYIKDDKGYIIGSVYPEPQGGWTWQSCVQQSWSNPSSPPEANRMDAIIKNVRFFSRKSDFQMRELNINVPIEDSFDIIGKQLEISNISVIKSLAVDLPLINGDKNQLGQVFLNLLMNAKDAVLEKTTKREDFVDMIIGIKSYQVNQFIIVEVTDNGIGIENDDINNIMLPFYTTKDEGMGTGLGLSICYQIVKEMDGTIEIISDRVDGTMIKLIIDTQKKK